MKDALQLYPLTDVHDALRRAVLSEKNKVTLINANFKVDPLRKEVAEEICKQNGTTLSAFLRHCADALILDYGGPGLAEKLGIDASL